MYLALIICLTTFALASFGPPSSLSNFQSQYLCHNTSKLLNPLTTDDIQSAIGNTSGPIRPLSYGHSWNYFMCPAHDSEGSIGITTTSLKGREITVDEERLTVKVDAAVKTVDLLNFLSNFVTPSSPTGYTLLSFPWQVHSLDLNGTNPDLPTYPH